MPVLLLFLTAALHAPAPTVIQVRLSEWKVEASAAATPAGPVRFVITNAGSIPHAFEVEGPGLERETHLLRPGQVDSLTVTLRRGDYELYCPVGNGSHEHLGMIVHLRSGTTTGATPSRSGASGPTTDSPARGILVRGGGPVVQILPGPFPFKDSAETVIAARPVDQQADLHHKMEQGPYSNNVAVIGGTAEFSAWDRGATGDSVSGTAEFTTQDGTRWRLVLDHVQTRDVPFNPRFGGVILGLYYHGASGVHTPLVPTITSAVALWAYGHLYRNDALVAEAAPVHIMLLSRTRRENDFALSCWDCSHNPVEELQLQIAPAPGGSPFEAPGGVLFVNWEKATARGT